MKKLFIAPVLLAALFALTGGQRPVAAAPSAPEFGACRWYCNNGVSFTTKSACTAACGPECEQVC
jgi:hypothetical protein